MFEIESIGDCGNIIYLDEFIIFVNVLLEVVIVYLLDGMFYNGDGLLLVDVMWVEVYDLDGEID